MIYMSWIRNLFITFGAFWLSSQAAVLFIWLFAGLNSGITYGDSLLAAVAMGVMTSMGMAVAAAVAAALIMFLVASTRPQWWAVVAALLYAMRGRGHYHSYLPPTTWDRWSQGADMLWPVIACVASALIIARFRGTRPQMPAEKAEGRRRWVVVAAVVIIVVVAIIAIKLYRDALDAPWSLVTPSQQVEAATRIAELRDRGRFDDAVELGLRSAKGQPGDDFIFQTIATTYFMRAFQDTDQRGKWMKLGAEYSQKAMDFNPMDVANVFNVGLNYRIVGEDLDTGGCEYYRKAQAVFESLAPRLQGDRAETQGRTVRLAPFRKRNEEELSRVNATLRNCQQTEPVR
ncbi:MAG: hypothetical protein LAO23_04810 [Acidobacteriia bacterium]|nr:hypothetical protein [Terriglobia bacterium]